jgi:hypothetical protein
MFVAAAMGCALSSSSFSSLLLLLLLLPPLLPPKLCKGWTRWSLILTRRTSNHAPPVGARTKADAQSARAAAAVPATKRGSRRFRDGFDVISSIFCLKFDILCFKGF